MVYNGLTKFDEHLVPHPELAESIDNENATVWHIRLRKGVLFHDGKNSLLKTWSFHSTGIKTRQPLPKSWDWRNS